jgi:hypothetical protein
MSAQLGLRDIKLLDKLSIFIQDVSAAVIASGGISSGFDGRLTAMEIQLQEIQALIDSIVAAQPVP